MPKKILVMGLGEHSPIDNGLMLLTIIKRVGRGARLVRQYPVLAGLFDDVLTVIAKLHISDAETLDEKHMI